MELTRFLVEVERPPDGWGELQRTVGDARRATAELSDDGVSIRLLRSVFVPEDDACFLVYEAQSAEAVGEAVRRAAIVRHRIAPQLDEEDLR
jgi:hypothetical protein